MLTGTIEASGITNTWVSLFCVDFPPDVLGRSREEFSECDERKVNDSRLSLAETRQVEPAKLIEVSLTSDVGHV